MFRRSFPDLDQLKKQIGARYASGEGWPNVVLNVSSRGDYRPGVQGPLSLFMNISGESHCSVGKHQVHIEEGAFFLTNAGDTYTLRTNETAPAETFNIHFGDAFAAEAFRNLRHNDEQLLDNPGATASSPPLFFSRLYEKDRTLVKRIMAIRNSHRTAFDSPLLLEQQLAGVLNWLLLRGKKELKNAAALPALRHSSREEIYRRLLVALDFLHSHYADALSLDQLAAAACMSKFHFLRMFSAAFRKTPHEYLSDIRMQKARELLCSGYPAGETALMTGFGDQSSFSRAFRKHFGTTPGNMAAAAG